MKALEVNLRPEWYGTFAEIGAGQEVVRWFFKVGGAAGTVRVVLMSTDSPTIILWASAQPVVLGATPLFWVEYCKRQLLGKWTLAVLWNKCSSWCSGAPNAPGLDQFLFRQIEDTHCIGT